MMGSFTAAPLREAIAPAGLTSAACVPHYRRSAHEDARRMQKSVGRDCPAKHVSDAAALDDRTVHDRSGRQVGRIPRPPDLLESVQLVLSDRRILGGKCQNGYQ